ncbi:MAG: polyprenyl synthetase family protein [Acidobacteriota bacterium]|nr:polyprenyl synthetase family protein [Acidobacteriota bacterium]MDH3531244.1 polyprenyl synthetase family protein [Acidobacteriota bacterium]
MNKIENPFAELRAFTARQTPSFESALRDYLPRGPAHLEKQFAKAAEHHLFPGGERVRPLLVLLAADLVGGKAEDVIPASVAVEYIHTASTIFEDLPFMGATPRRRGREPLHEESGEGLAILVGLGFLNAAYPLVFVNQSGEPKYAIEAHSEIVECVGAAGLIGGQYAAAVGGGDSNGQDAASAGPVRNLKTSALLRLAMRTGAILSGADYIELAGISRFAEHLGDAYQLRDSLAEMAAGTVVDPEVESFDEGTGRSELLNRINSAKRILVEEFDGNEARSCLIQLADFLVGG